MSAFSSERLLAVASDIESELAKVAHVADDVRDLRAEFASHPDVARWLAESMALKLHNFYTGCERVFQIVATEMNGGLPAGSDWHRRLLDRMSKQRDQRIAVIGRETAAALEPFLGFRHIVRNIYGYELNERRLMELADDMPAAWGMFERDVRGFVAWLRKIADEA